MVLAPRRGVRPIKVVRSFPFDGELSAGKEKVSPIVLDDRPISDRCQTRQFQAPCSGGSRQRRTVAPPGVEDPGRKRAVHYDALVETAMGAGRAGSGYQGVGHRRSDPPPGSAELVHNLAAIHWSACTVSNYVRPGGTMGATGCSPPGVWVRGAPLFAGHQGHANLAR